jgi:hypothetical protein
MSRPPQPPQFVLLTSLGQPGPLSADERIGILARAIEELGIAMGLIMIHGEDRGIRRYEETRDLVRRDGSGAIWVRWP